MTHPAAVQVLLGTVRPYVIGETSEGPVGSYERRRSKSAKGGMSSWKSNWIRSAELTKCGNAARRGHPGTPVDIHLMTCST